jgi:hypothetical protein
MDAITTYLDHMFRGLPRTAEVMRARGELEQMSLDRYQELLAEGVSEHEAVGRVISQFGNLDDLADDLGIREQVDRADDPDESLFVSREARERFLGDRTKMALLIGGGIVVIMLGLIATILLNEGDLAPDGLTGGIFLVTVAVAVGFFILGGFTGNRFRELERKRVRLADDYERELQHRRDGGQLGFALQIAAGVILIILGVAATPILSGLGVESYSAATVFVGVALGVPLLVHAGVHRASLDRLLGAGEFAPVSPEQERSNSIIGRIAGPYWLLTVAVFLVWSFGWDAWGRSWIIWPVAGVLFAFVSVLVNSIRNTNDAR